MADDLKHALEGIALAQDPKFLCEELTGYVITITDQDSDDGNVVMEQPLRLSRVGGAQIKGMADLIMMIEDAVFTNEQKKED